MMESNLCFESFFCQFLHCDNSQPDTSIQFQKENKLFLLKNVTLQSGNYCVLTLKTHLFFHFLLLEKR